MFTIVQAASGDSRSQATVAGRVGVEWEDLGTGSLVDSPVAEFPFRSELPAGSVGEGEAEPAVANVLKLGVRAGSNWSLSSHAFPISSASASSYSCGGSVLACVDSRMPTQLLEVVDVEKLPAPA
jgi:hypothetical protein